MDFNKEWLEIKYLKMKVFNVVNFQIVELNYIY